MKLIRFASIYLCKNTIINDIVEMSFDMGKVTVDVRDASHDCDKTRLLIEASITLDSRPEVSFLGVVTVPEQARKLLEAEIEKVANFLAVINHSRRAISSPWPFAAIFIEDEDEGQWASGLDVFSGEVFSIRQISYRLSPTSKHWNALADRFDGVSLMAEALAQEHATGRFREFMRLFERAFARGIPDIKGKLSQFLRGADLGYDGSEVGKWIELRNPATHANNLADPRIILESDLITLIDRIEQAAFDVLLNKKTWANFSKERRQVWVPPAATTSPTNDVRVTKGFDLDMVIRTLDPFGVFAYDASLGLTFHSANYWASWPPIRQVFSGTLTVVDQLGRVGTAHHPGPDEVGGAHPTKI